jgi:hypothetical protein
MGANVATVVCPEGPRVRSFIGRVDSDAMPPDGLLPDVNAEADALIKLFEDKTIRAHGLVALVVSTLVLNSLYITILILIRVHILLVSSAFSNLRGRLILKTLLLVSGMLLFIVKRWVIPLSVFLNFHQT